MAFVLDCSVAMARVFPDEASKATTQLRGSLTDGRAFVPSLWPVEVGSALLAGTCRGHIRADEWPEISAKPDTLPMGPISMDSHRPATDPFHGSHGVTNVNAPRHATAPVADADHAVDEQRGSCHSVRGFDRSCLISSSAASRGWPSIRAPYISRPNRHSRYAYGGRCLRLPIDTVCPFTTPPIWNSPCACDCRSSRSTDLSLQPRGRPESIRPPRCSRAWGSEVRNSRSVRLASDRLTGCLNEIGMASEKPAVHSPTTSNELEPTQISR